MNNTMKLEQQVVSLELAKQLEELDIEQDSLFYWCSYTHFVEGEMVTDWMLESKESMKVKGLDVGLTYSAFTVAELGNLMPKEIEDTNSEGLKRLFFFDTWKCNSGFLWRCAYSYYENMNRANTRIEYLKGVDGDIGAETEADARAKMLIWLIEEGYITQ